MPARVKGKNKQINTSQKQTNELLFIYLLIYLCLFIYLFLRFLLLSSFLRFKIELISLIFDKNMMTKALETLKIDVKKMPLGKIKKSQIRGKKKQKKNHIHKHTPQTHT
jgi:hypothetical protein